MLPILIAAICLGQTCGPNGCTAPTVVSRPQYTGSRPQYVVQRPVYVTQKQHAVRRGLFKKKCR